MGGRGVRIRGLESREWLGSRAPKLGAVETRCLGLSFLRFLLPLSFFLFPFVFLLFAVTDELTRVISQLCLHPSEGCLFLQ